MISGTVVRATVCADLCVASEARDGFRYTRTGVKRVLRCGVIETPALRRYSANSPPLHVPFRK